MFGAKIQRFLFRNLTGKEQKFNTIKLYEIVLAILFIVFGIIFLLNKMASDQSIAIFLGVLVAIDALLNIYSAVTKESNRLFKFNLISAVLYIILAVFFFTNVIGFLNYIAIYFGAYLFIVGLKQIIYAVVLKIVGEASFLIVLIMGLLISSLGGLLIFYPFTSFGTIEIVAIYGILLGLLKMNSANLLRSRVEFFLSELDND